MPDLHGRRAIITGSNAGLGFETAAVLLGAGAEVVLACRNQTKAAAARDELIARTGRSSVEVRRLDLADLSSVEAFAGEVIGSADRLDLLINNAGLMAIDESRTVDGLEMQFGVNHVGHSALTARLLPLLTSTPNSRIVTVSSMGHRAGRLHRRDPMFERRRYRRWPPYLQSKLANLLFTAELHRRLVEAGLATIALAAHPGASHTDLGTEGTSLSNRLMSTVVPWATQSAAAGALPIVRAAVDPEARSGEFYGPRWIVRGRPVLEIPSRRARRSADAEFLWHLTNELHGVAWPLEVDTAVSRR